MLEYKTDTAYELKEVFNQTGLINGSMNTEFTEFRSWSQKSRETLMRFVADQLDCGFILAITVQVNFQTLMFYCP